MPTKLTNIMSITQPNDLGDKFVINGTIFKPDEKTPYPDVILYAYHTDPRRVLFKKGK